MSPSSLPVAFAADALASPGSGIGGYVRGLLGAMAELSPRPNLRLFHSGRRRLDAFADTWPTRWIRLPSRLLAAVSVWGPLPIEILAGRSRLLHSPDSMAVHSRAPLVLTVHDLVVFKMPGLFPDIYTDGYNPGYRHYREGARRAIPRAAHIICVSESTRRDLQELFDIPQERISVIPYGAPQPPPQFRPAAPNGEPRRILFMGRVEHRKNLPTAVAAVARLREGGIAAELVVCGDDRGPESSEIRAQCLRQADGWIRFRGALSPAQVWEEYSRASALIYPSWYEGFGLPPFEAFQAGVPVVASRSSSLGELLEGAAELCDPSAPDQFGDALARVVGDGAHREKLIAAGRQRAREYTWQRAAEQTVKVYDRFR